MLRRNTQSGGKDEADDDAARFGIEEEVGERDDADVEPFEVWPENVQAVRIFIQLARQWEFAGGGFGPLVYVCIPAERVEAELRMRGVKRANVELLRDQLNDMERAARPVLNRRDDE